MTAPRPIPSDLSSATPRDILELAHAHQVRFLRLQFTDILGVNKNVEVPASQFQKALAGDILFDGSSIEGFVRVEESDMLLQPDLSTFRIFPWGDPHSKVARVICDVTTPEGKPFAGDPRQVLKQQVARAAALGYVMNAGMEAEFFLFKQGADGGAATLTHDVAGTSTSPRWIAARRRAARSSPRSSRWASRWRPRTTRWRTASTRSTSATPMR
jgi:glutamine synthetase